MLKNILLIFIVFISIGIMKSFLNQSNSIKDYYTDKDDEIFKDVNVGQREMPKLPNDRLSEEIDRTISGIGGIGFPLEEIESEEILKKYSMLATAILKQESLKKINNSITKSIRIYYSEDMKYQLLRLEKEIHLIEGVRKERNARIMAANHFVFEPNKDLNERVFASELEGLGISILSQKRFSEKYIITFDPGDLNNRDEFIEKLKELRNRPDLGKVYIDYVFSII